jgi:hypothetical protein
MLVMPSSCPFGARAEPRSRRRLPGQRADPLVASGQADHGHQQPGNDQPPAGQTLRLDAPMDIAWLLSQLDRAPHGREPTCTPSSIHPAAVLWHCGQPPSRLPAGWNLQLPPGAERVLAVRRPRVRDRCCVSPLVVSLSTPADVLELKLVPAHHRLAFGQPERQMGAITAAGKWCDVP